MFTFNVSMAHVISVLFARFLNVRFWFHFYVCFSTGSTFARHGHVYTSFAVTYAAVTEELENFVDGSRPGESPHFNNETFIFVIASTGIAATAVAPAADATSIAASSVGHFPPCFLPFI